MFIGCDFVFLILKENFHWANENFFCREFIQSLGKRHPDCLSTSKKVKSKCDGTFSADEVCDEYGTTATCCTPDCKLKPDAACSPVCFLDFHIFDIE